METISYCLTVGNVVEMAECSKYQVLKHVETGHLKPIRDKNNYRMFRFADALKLKEILHPNWWEKLKKSREK